MPQNWTVKPIHIDYEFENKRKRLRNQKRIDVVVTLAWVTVGLLVAVWVRVLYIAIMGAVHEIQQLFNQ